MNTPARVRTVSIANFQQQRLREASALIARISKNETALLSLWAAVDEMERLLPDSEFMRAVYFGSARINDPSHPIYEETRYLSMELARLGFDCVTGGGPALMHAASEGASLGGNSRILIHGACIQQVNREEVPSPLLMRAFTHRSFPSRLHHFVVLGRRGIFIGLRAAGIGTLLEVLLIWQMLQVAHIIGCPLVVLGEFWDDLKEVMRKHMVRDGTATGAEIDILRVVYHPDDVIAIAAEEQKKFFALKAAS